MMNDRSYSASDGRRALIEAFNTVDAYKSQAKDISAAIAETKKAICEKLGIAPKGFDMALKYWGMTDRERRDIDTVLTYAQQAIEDNQPDMFVGAGEVADMIRAGKLTIGGENAIT